MKEQQTTGKKETVKAFVWNFSSKVVTYLLLLVLGNLYIVSEYGKATFVLAIYSLVVMVAIFGLPNAIIPWITKKKDYNSVFKVLFYFSVLAAIGLLVFTFLMIKTGKYNKELVYPIIFIAISIILYWINNVSASFLIVKKRYDIVSFISFLAIVITLIFSIFFKMLNGFGIILAYFCGFLFSAIAMSLAAYENIFKILKSKINFGSFKDYAKEGFIISIIALSFYFLGWADATILGILSNLENVGKYNIASAFANIVALIPMTLAMFVITRMSEIKSKEKSKRVLKRVIRVSYFFSSFVAILISSYLFIITRIFFPKYIGIEIYASILLIGALFYSNYFLIYNYIIAKGGVRKNFSPIIIASIVNIILDFILIPKIGIYGVCVATAFAHFIAFLLLGRKIFSLKEITMIIIFSLSVLLAYYVSYYGILLAIVMAFIMVKTRLIEKEDIMIIKQEIGKIFNKN